MPFTYDNATGGQEGQPEEKGDNRWYAFSSPVLIYRKKIDCAYTANVVSNCRDDDEPLVCLIFMFYGFLYIFSSNVHLQMNRLKVQSSQ